MDGVTGAGAEDDGPVLLLPSTGPDPLSFGVALTALRGYARGRRPLRFRSPDSPRGRWVQVPRVRLVPVRRPPRGATGGRGRADRRAVARQARPRRLGDGPRRPRRGPSSDRRRRAARGRPGVLGAAGRGAVRAR